MDDREAFINVADAIAEWQLTAQQLPLPELCATAADSQNDLAHCLNAFNGIYLAHDDGTALPADVRHAIGEVTRRATALAIFTLGIAHRVHLTAHQT